MSSWRLPLSSLFRSSNARTLPLFPIGPTPGYSLLVVGHTEGWSQTLGIRRRRGGINSSSTIHDRPSIRLHDKAPNVGWTQLLHRQPLHSITGNHSSASGSWDDEVAASASAAAPERSFKRLRIEGYAGSSSGSASSPQYQQNSHRNTGDNGGGSVIGSGLPVIMGGVPMHNPAVTAPQQHERMVSMSRSRYDGSLV